jgi:hypothetical protein
VYSVIFALTLGISKLLLLLLLLQKVYYLHELKFTLGIARQQPGKSVWFTF